MKEIYPSLYQFGITIPGMGFTIHQYLLNGETPVLFATGTIQQAKTVLPEMKELLGGKKLAYIFVSHMESDECGGLSVFLDEYPEAKVLCSELTARELPGYGIQADCIVCTEEQELKENGLEMQFIDYPSEVHMQNGIIALDQNTGVLYSADLFLSFGEAAGLCKKSDWIQEIEKIDEERVPNIEMLEKLQDSLRKVKPNFIAVGHGYCLEV